jgi:hypothetical protein
VNPRKKKPVLFEVVARTERSKARASGPPRKPWLRLVGGNTLDAGGPVLPPSVAASPFLARWAWLVLAGAVVVIAVVTGVQVGWRSAQPPATQAGDAGELLATPAEAPRTEAPYPVPVQGRVPTTVATPERVAREDKPAPPVAGRPSEAASERGPAPATARPAENDDPNDRFVFTPGAYYVVVQHFRIRDRDRAVAAREYLRGKGVECVVRRGGGDLELVATTAFNGEGAARDLVKRILDLGKEYWTSGGGYEFTGAKARRF